MNLRQIILLFTVTLAFILYTGCIKGRKYIFTQPSATVFASNGRTVVMHTSTVSVQDMSIVLRVNMQDVKVAGLQLPGNYAYATSFKEPAPFPLEKITDIRVRPLHAYNDGYGMLDDISEICTFSYNAEGNDTISEGSVIEGINLADDRIGMHDVYIYLQDPPAGVHTQQFVVELITDNNSRLADTTVKFILTP